MDTDQKKGHGEKYSRLKEGVLGALMCSKTIGEAAQKAGIAESTVRRWLKKPNFRNEYDERKRRLYEEAVSELPEAMADAIRVLHIVVNDYRDEHSIRVTAANAILNFYNRATPRLDTERRLSALERKVAGERTLGTEDAIVENQEDEDDVEEGEADMVDTLPEAQITTTEDLVTSPSAQMSADDGKENDENNVGGLNLEAISECFPDNGGPTKDRDTHGLISTPTNEPQPETETPGAPLIATQSPIPETQVSADERKNEIKQGQDRSLLAPEGDGGLGDISKAGYKSRRLRKATGALSASAV
ncbi:MAG TPA: MerR family transcriptional regulator [Syntrophorhabdaceae bacterium]|nr:MerR family transcriptional regulator [Syntrophorhabdaceae bacterium]